MELNSDIFSYKKVVTRSRTKGNCSFQGTVQRFNVTTQLTVY